MTKPATESWEEEKPGAGKESKAKMQMNPQTETECRRGKHTVLLGDLGSLPSPLMLGTSHVIFNGVCMVPRGMGSSDASPSHRGE